VNEPETSPRPDTLDISVVVPVRDEAETISLLLEDLLKQSLKPREIVITDGGSTDATVQIIENFIRDGAPVRLVREQDSLPGRARNVGVEHAACQWIAFIDAGIRPVPEWLESLAQKVLDDATVDVVYGTYEPVTDTFFTECAAIAYVPAPFASEDGLVRPRSIVSALMRREVWKFAGGFPENLRSAEDLIFMRRIEQANCRTVRASRAVVYWWIQPTLWLTFKRFVEYSRNNIRAGLFWDWQGTILIYYAILAVPFYRVLRLDTDFTVKMDPFALLVTPVLWVLLMSVRAAKALWRNRLAYPAGLIRNLARFVLLLVILIAIDAAAILGTIKWLLSDWRRKPLET
jgi:glycosyltransferase involved in cell wall biosynthesis